MSDEQKPPQQPQPQNDFFSDLMFGRRPEPPKPEVNNDSEPNAQAKAEETQTPEKPKSPENTQPDQLDSIFALVQSLGPVIDKLAPLAGAFSSYLSQNKKDSTNKTTSTNKNAND